MGIVLTAMVAATVWVFLWGLDVKGIDSLMIALLILLGAAIAHVTKPFLPGARPSEETHPDPAPYT